MSFFCLFTNTMALQDCALESCLWFTNQSHTSNAPSSDCQNAPKVPSCTRINCVSYNREIVGRDAISPMLIRVRCILVFTPLLVFSFNPNNHVPISRYISGEGHPNWRCFVTIHKKNFLIVLVAFWHKISCNIEAINTCFSAGKMASGLRMTTQDVTHPCQSLSYSLRVDSVRQQGGFAS